MRRYGRITVVIVFSARFDYVNHIRQLAMNMDDDDDDVAMDCVANKSTTTRNERRHKYNNRYRDQVLIYNNMYLLIIVDVE